MSKTKKNHARRQRTLSPAGALSAALLLTFSFDNFAAETQDTRKLDVFYISASSLPVTEAAATQHVTVLTREALAAMGEISIAEALARQAGIVVDRSPRSGGYGSLYLRGADPSHVVVLIDNVRQNDPLSSRGSAVDLNTLTTGDVERIEIVRGNASVVHAEALAGLIHIFTRAARDASYLNAAVGGDGLRALQAGLAAGDFRAGAAHREDGEDATGFNRTRSANLSWRKDFERAGALALAARYADSLNLAFPDDSGGEQYALRRALDTRRAHGHQVSLQATVNEAGPGRVELQAQTLSRDGTEATAGVAGGVRDPAGLPPLTTRTTYRRDELQALWIVATPAHIDFTLGLHHQHERGELASLISFGRFSLPANFTLSRTMSSIFSEARFQSGPWTVQGGVRHEIPDQGASLTHPSLALQRELGDALGRWGLSVSRAAKLPSFYALGHPLVGDPNLRTERATQRELYYATAESVPWPTRLTLFSARYSDLIDFDAGPPPRLVNRARIHADGFEWSTRHSFDNRWRLLLDGTLMRVKDPDGIAKLRFRPNAQGSAQLQIPLSERLELSLSAKYTGRSLDSAIPTGDRTLAARNTVDTALRLSAGRAQFTVAIDNLFNSDKPETIGTPTPSRRLRLALTVPLP